MAEREPFGPSPRLERPNEKQEFLFHKNSCQGRPLDPLKGRRGKPCAPVGGWRYAYRTLSNDIQNHWLICSPLSLVNSHPFGSARSGPGREAAKRTLDGEDRSGIIQGEGKRSSGPVPKRPQKRDQLAPFHRSVSLLSAPPLGAVSEPSRRDKIRTRATRMGPDRGVPQTPAIQGHMPPPLFGGGRSRPPLFLPFGTGGPIHRG